VSTLVELIWLFAVMAQGRVLVVQEKNGKKSLALGIKDGVRKVGKKKTIISKQLLGICLQQRSQKSKSI
jgi:hypothetical protein